MLEHPAVKAWLQARPEGPEPAGITLLKEKEKSAVYRLAGVGPGASAVVAKRCGADSARVERVVYAVVLARLPVPSLRYHGCVEGPEAAAGCSWRSRVADKYSPDLEEHRRLAGRWLGLLHTVGGAPGRRRPPARPGARPLPGVPAAGARHRPGEPGPPRADRRRPGGAEVAAGRVRRPGGPLAAGGAVCAGMPRTLVHGDFIKRNLRVRPGPAGPRWCPIDWEFAGWGPPAVDLAAAAL